MIESRGETAQPRESSDLLGVVNSTRRPRIEVGFVTRRHLGDARTHQAGTEHGDRIDGHVGLAVLVLLALGLPAEERQSDGDQMESSRISMTIRWPSARLPVDEAAEAIQCAIRCNEVALACP